MKRIYISFLGSIITCASWAQNPLITGRITGPDQQGLKGVSVSQPGHETVITDESGNFSMACGDSVRLTFTQPGYQSISKLVTDCNTPLQITMNTVKELDTIEITATSNTNKNVLYLPQSVTKLQEPELKRGTGLFLDDAINQNVPGVYMERRTVSAGQQFNIRGYGNGARGTNGINSNFDGQGYKVYLNNIPITDAEGITLMDDIDFASIGNVEIIKGPAGSLYGLAVAGVVNLQTVKAEKNKSSIAQNAIAGSYGLQRYTTTVKVGGEKTSLMANYGRQYYDGFMPHTASNKRFANLVGDIEISDKQTVGAYLGMSNSYDERNGELTIGQYDTLNYSGNPSYIKNNAHSEVISARAGMSHTYKFSKKLSNVTSVFGSAINSNVSSAGGWTDKSPLNYGFRSTLNFEHNFSEKVGISGITGLEVQRQDAQVIGYAMVVDSSNMSGYNIVGAMRSNQATVSKVSSYFTEWTLKLPGDISILAGVGLSEMRIVLNDRFYVASTNKKTRLIPTQFAADYNNMLSPHFAINKVFSKALSVYVSYSKGYKAPVSSYFYIPTTGEVNRNLRPEVAEQLEFGTKGNLFNDKLQYQAAYFRTNYYQKMTAVAVPLNSVTTAYSYMVNGGAQDHQGVEFLLKLSLIDKQTGALRSLKPFVNFCYSDFNYGTFKFQTLNAARTSAITTDYTNKVVAGVPPLTANAGLDFGLLAGIYGNVNWMYRDAMFYTSDNLNKTKSFSVLNAKLGIRRKLGKHFDLDLYGGANNLTGTQYYYMVFLNQLPDAYLAAPHEINFFGGLSIRYTF